MKKIKYIGLVILIEIVFSFFLLNLIGKKIAPILLRYVNIEAERFANNIVNSTVNEVIVKYHENDFFIIEKDKNDEISIIDYNTKKVNQLLIEITNEIQEKLINLEEGKIKDLEISSNFQLKNMSTVKNGILCEIPMGTIKGNFLFANIGPNIPIKLSFIGQVQANLDTKIINYGINNIVIENNIIVEVEERITMPTTSEKSIVKITAPLSIKIIKGKVPNYYASNIGKQSEIISVPLE